jgi:hypothetical protein
MRSPQSDVGENEIPRLLHKLAATIEARQGNDESILHDMRRSAGAAARAHAADVRPVTDVDREAEVDVAIEHRAAHDDVGLMGRQVGVVGDEDVAGLRLRKFRDNRPHRANERAKVDTDAARLDHHPARPVEQRTGKVVALRKRR